MRIAYESKEAIKQFEECISAIKSLNGKELL